MRNNLKILLSVLALIQLSEISFTQTITTDYNSCMQGVKGESGDWIIQPQYEYLREDKKGYVAQNGGKYGFIDKTGRVLIPLQYDYVTTTWQRFYYDPGVDYAFTVTLNHKKGVVDTANRIIVPILYERIIAYKDSIIGARLGKQSWTFYNLQGVGFACPLKTEDAPYRILPHRYTVTKKKFFVRDPRGLIDDSSHVIVPRKYDMITGYDETNTIFMSDKKKYGYFTSDAHTIFPMEFSDGYNYGLYSSRFGLVAVHGIGPAWYNNKAGLISIKGDTILPFIYDNIAAHGFDYFRGSSHLWSITKDGKSGIYDDRKGWIVPAECDELENIATFYADDDSSAVSLVYYSINGKWGAKTTSGQEVLPCIYDEVMSDNRELFIFRKGDSLMTLTLNTNAAMLNLGYQFLGDSTRFSYYSAWPVNGLAPAGEIFPTFNGYEDVTAYYYPASTRKQVYCKGAMHIVDKGNYYNFTVPDTIVVSCVFFTKPLRSPLIQKNDLIVYHYDRLERTGTTGDDPDLAYLPHNEYKMAIVTEKIIHNQDTFYQTMNYDVFTPGGHLIFSGDTIMNLEFWDHGTNGELYFTFFNRKGWAAADPSGKIKAGYSRNQIIDYSDKYMWTFCGDEYYQYNLVNITTGANVLSKKEHSDQAFPIWDSITMIDNKSIGICIYNLKQRKYVIKGMNNVIALDEQGQSFAVKTCSGKMGVITCGGKWLLDTIFTAMTPYGILKEFTASNFSGYTYDQMLYASWHVFSNDTFNMVFEPATKSIKPLDIYTDQFWSLLNYEVAWNSINSFVLDSSMSRTKNESVYFLTAPTERAEYTSWKKQCIVDSVFTSQREFDITSYSYIYHEFFSSYDCMYCIKKKGPRNSFAWTRGYSVYGRFRTHFQNDSVISFCKSRSDYGGAMEYMHNSWFSTVMLFPAGPRSMTFDSLFDPATDWRNYVINAVLSYVNTHENIKGDCHNPAGIPPSLQSQFMITANGIEVYPPEFEENDRQLKIFLPWKEAAPYLRNDVKSKLPLPKI